MKLALVGILATLPIKHVLADNIIDKDLCNNIEVKSIDVSATNVRISPPSSFVPKTGAPVLSRTTGEPIQSGFDSAALFEYAKNNPFLYDPSKNFSNDPSTLIYTSSEHLDGLDQPKPKVQLTAVLKLIRRVSLDNPVQNWVKIYYQYIDTGVSQLPGDIKNESAIGWVQAFRLGVHLSKSKKAYKKPSRKASTVDGIDHTTLLSVLSCKGDYVKVGAQDLDDDSAVVREFTSKAWIHKDDLCSQTEESNC